MNIYFRFIILLIFSTFLSVKGDVFTLNPFSKNKGGVNIHSPEDLSTAINPDKLWDEPVVINGEDLTLGVSISAKHLLICIKDLENLYPNARYLINQNTALIEVLDSNGYKNRIYLVEVGGKFPVVQFSMTIPPQKKEITDWPSALPLPSGAKPLTYMYFADRKSYYGHFECNYLGSEQEIYSLLSSEGWKATTQSNVGDGEIFIKNKPRQILILRMSDTKGSIYTRRLK